MTNTHYTPAMLAHKINTVIAPHTSGPALILHPYTGRRDGDEYDRANAADGYTEPLSADYHERNTLTADEQAEGLTVWESPDREYTPEISDYAADVHVCTDKNSAREILRALRIRDQARTQWQTALGAHDTAGMTKATATGKAAQRAADQAIARHDDAAMRYAINGTEAHRRFLLSMDDAPPANEQPTPLHSIESGQGSDGDDHGPHTGAAPITWTDDAATITTAARRDGHLWARCPLNHYADPKPGTQRGTTPPLHVTEPEANTPHQWADQWQILGDVAAVTGHDPNSEQAKTCARLLRDATQQGSNPETVAEILATYTVPQHART